MFPQLSENVANSVYWIGWTLFLLSAMAGLAGTVMTLWGEKERERFSDIRLSDNEKQIELAKLEAAKANERTAKIQSLVAWRTINNEQNRIIYARLKDNPSQVRIRYLDGDPEVLEFAISISKVFGGWKVVAESIAFPSLTSEVTGLAIVGGPIDLQESKMG